VRRLHQLQWALGLACTLVVAGAWRAGAFDLLELPTLDLRTRWFHRWSKGASESIVLMGIDDAATEARGLGRWPWSRDVLARGIDELRRASAKTIALDILLDEPQSPMTDRALVEAIDAHAGVVLPFRSRADAPAGMVTSLLLAQGEDTRRVMADHSPEVAAHIISSRLNREAASVERVRAAIPGAQSIVGAEGSSSFPAPASGPAFRAGDVLFPLPELTRAAACVGDVSVEDADRDFVFRRLPLLTRLGEGRLWPSFSLAAVAHFNDTPLTHLAVEGEGRIVIPGDRTIRIRTDGGAYTYVVTWPRGGETWLGQFEGSARYRQEVSILAAFEPYLVERAQAANLASLEELLALATRLKLGDYQKAVERVREAREVPLESPGWQEAIEEVAGVAAPAAEEARDFLEFAGPADLVHMSERDAITYLEYLAVARQIPALVEECRGARDRVEAARLKLRQLVAEKLVFVGWTASGAVADAVNTSIGPRTPGVYIHAAAASAMLTGRNRLAVPGWADFGFILLVGTGGILAARRAGVWAAPFLLAGILAAWGALAGAVVWDALDLRAAVVAPSAAGLFSWTAVLLHRLLIEQRLRRRTEERFRAYVSPDVVDELVNNPAQDSMTPQRRELSIMFCDVTGFTAIAERLGAEGTARFLSTYLGRMTDTLLRHNATIDKYLGDGIMAFWGAPLADPRHARNACRAAIALARTVAEVASPEPGADQIGRISIRIGLAAGDVMVGDFGNPPIRSSYTVLGDACNVAARLERASKHLGTTVLASASIRAQAGEGFLWRPLGSFVLHGRQSAEPIFELVGVNASGGKADVGDTLVLVRADDTPLPQVYAWIESTEAAVAAYAAGHLTEARELFGRLARDHGDTLLAAVYTAAIDEAAGSDAPPGPVVLREG
jgi:class 3 adenylate cyclase/CHASE2 domain-containing sensor protein